MFEISFVSLIMYFITKYKGNERNGNIHSSHWFPPFMQKANGMSDRSNDALEYLSPTSNRSVFFHNTKTVVNESSCNINNPYLTEIDSPNASIKYSTGPLWSKMSLYKTLPSSNAAPIDLKTAESLPSQQNRGDVVKE